MKCVKSLATLCKLMSGVCVRQKVPLDFCLCRSPKAGFMARSFAQITLIGLARPPPIEPKAGAFRNCYHASRWEAAGCK